MEIRRDKIIYFAYFLVFLGALLRLLPHMPNFAPIAGIALFSAVYIKGKTAFFLPAFAMIISDLFIGFDSLESRVIVYSSFLIIGLIGLAVKRNKNIFTIVLGSLAGSVVFYLVTNFALFYPVSMYTHNLEGIITSYVNALPFFRNTLLGDLFYVSLLFGVYEFALAWTGKKKFSTIRL